MSKRKEARKLTPNQQRFVEEYLIDRNGQAAYERAYKARGPAAQVNASKLLLNAMVREAVDAGLKRLADKSEIKASRVLDELKAIAFSDIGEILDFTQDPPTLRDPADMSETARCALSAVKIRHGDDGTIVEFKLWDKPGALRDLGRHLKLFTDQVETPDLDAHIEQLLARVRRFQLRTPSSGIWSTVGAGSQTAKAGRCRDRRRPRRMVDRGLPALSRRRLRPWQPDAMGRPKRHGNGNGHFSGPGRDGC
jgi:phage terminase small subunit